MNTPFVRLQLDSIAESEFEFYCTRSALGRVYRIVVMYCIGSTHGDYEAYSFVCAVDRRHLGLRSKETRVKDFSFSFLVFTSRYVKQHKT